MFCLPPLFAKSLQNKYFIPQSKQAGQMPYHSSNGTLDSVCATILTGARQDTIQTPQNRAL